MKEDILKYSPTVMFRGTPCRFRFTFTKGAEVRAYKLKTVIRIL